MPIDQLPSQILSKKLGSGQVLRTLRSLTSLIEDLRTRTSNLEQEAAGITHDIEEHDNVSGSATNGALLRYSAGSGDWEPTNEIRFGDGLNRIVFNATAGEAISANEIVYLNSDGNVYLTDADAESTSAGLLLYAESAVAISNSDDFVFWGVVDESGLTRGDEYYLSNTPGALTATPPIGTGDIVRKIGVATATDKLLFYPSADWMERN